MLEFLILKLSTDKGVNSIILLTFSSVSCCAFGYTNERFQYFVELAMGLNLVALIEFSRFSTFNFFF